MPFNRETVIWPTRHTALDSGPGLFDGEGLFMGSEHSSQNWHQNFSHLL